MPFRNYSWENHNPPLRHVVLYEGGVGSTSRLLHRTNLLTGTFEQAGFADGDKVKVIVTKLDDQACSAHGVARMSDGRLWLPFASAEGRLKP